MVSTPILAGAFLRIVLSLLVDRIGTERIPACSPQLVVMWAAHGCRLVLWHP